MDFAVIRLSSFGDIILTEPVTRAIKERHPEARVYFIARSEFAGVPVMFEAVDEVMPYSKAGHNNEIERLGKVVDFEAVLDLQNNLRSRRISGRLKKKRLVRYRRPVVRRFLTVKMPWLYKGNLRHTVDLYGDALARLDIPLQGRQPRIEPGGEARAKAQARFGPVPVQGRFVALCPGGSSEFKRWPESSFAELAVLLHKSGERVMVAGSEEDRRQVEVVAALAAEAGPMAVVSGDPAELAALLSRMVVTVTNDSGLMHLAAAVGSMVVAVFGPTSPSLGFGPLGPRHRVISLGLGCSPCSYHGNRPCRMKRRVCMEDLTPEEVRREVLLSLGDVEYE